jgi:hypothetical protein
MQMLGMRLGDISAKVIGKVSYELDPSEIYNN